MLDKADWEVIPQKTMFEQGLKMEKSQLCKGSAARETLQPEG